MTYYAVEWVAQTGLGVDDTLNYERQVEYLTLVRLLLAQEKPEQSIRLLDCLIESAEEAGRTGETVEMLALKALIHQAQHETGVAVNVLEQALSRAEPGGYIRTFVDEGEAMKALLSEISSQKSVVSKAYIARLLAAFSESGSRGVEVQANSPVLPSPSPSTLIEPLSERELEVLYLIIDGATNQEIAQSLFITVNTVKKHVSNIFSKLGVSRRPQAIARVCELGLTKQ